ncbi:MAG: hypothetical protein IJG33_00600, partial [Selenomonadaceae bacterium]|nr:hypothetical protein [Selenomonadaceae bacterium]
LGDNGLSNSPAGCVSILSFHLFFSPISKKWIVLSYLHNPFYTTKFVVEEVLRYAIPFLSRHSKVF